MDWSGLIASYLNLGADTTKTRGAMLATLGTACQSAVEREIARTFENVEWTEVYNGGGRSTLYLRHDPILSVSSLSVNGSAITVGNPLAPTYPPARVVIDDTACLRFTDGSCFPCGAQNVIVTYTAGLALPDPDGGDGIVPAELLQAVTYWAALLYQDSDRLGLTSVTVQDQVTSFTRTVPDDVRRMVTQWKRGFIPTC